jgi:hypothetical protein
LSGNSFGQSTKYDSLFYPYKHAVYLEILGNAGTLLSLNYERILNPHSRAKLHYSLRTGLAAYKRRQDSVWVLNFPFEANFIYGKHKNYIESSIGYTASFGKPLVDSEYTPPAHFERYDHIYIFRLGYRYMYEGILVRVTPIYIYYPDFINKIVFSACISLGIAF